MRAGALRFRIEFLDRLEQSDGSGGTTVTGPVVVGALQMAFETLSGRALLTAQQIDPRARHRATGRWATGFVPQVRQQARVRGRLLEVVHVDEVGLLRRQVDVLLAETVN